MVTQNHFVIPATFLEKFRSRGFPEGVTLTADHFNLINTDLLLVDLLHVLEVVLLLQLPH